MHVESRSKTVRTGRNGTACPSVASLTLSQGVFGLIGTFTAGAFRVRLEICLRLRALFLSTDPRSKSLTEQ